MWRSRMWTAWLLCSVSGVLLIALPDADRRLFSISEGHGPGVTDMIGVLLLTAGWVFLDLRIWLGRRRLLGLRRVWLATLVLAAIGGAVVVSWSVTQDAGMWWVVGAALLAGAQLAAAVVVSADREDRGRGGGDDGRRSRNGDS